MDLQHALTNNDSTKPSSSQNPSRPIPSCPGQSVDASDNFGIERLEESLAKLGVSNSVSIIDDPVFQIFSEALTQPYSDLYELWQEVFTFQTYPDPVEYLITVVAFRKHIHEYEPGQQVDYKKMTDDLHDVQAFITGGESVVIDMYNFVTNLNGCHVQFMRYSVAMAGWQLFAKMVNRFYGVVHDPHFETFVKDTIEDYEHRVTDHWPSYESVIETIQAYINAAQLSVYKVAKELLRLKASAEFKSFHDNIESGRKEKQRDETKTQNDEAETSLSKCIGQQAQAALKKQRRAIVIRKKRAFCNKITKCNAFLEQNRNNIHQLGCMSRVLVSDNVVRALNTMQEAYQDTIFRDDDDDEMKICKVMQGMTVKVIDKETMESEMKEKEPLDGIVVEEGFSIINFGAQHN